LANRNGINTGGHVKTVPTYTLDSNLPPEERWDGLPNRLRQAGRTLAKRAVKNIEARGLVGPIAAGLRLATKWRNPYREEIKGAAAALGIPFDHAVITNFLYEIDSLAFYGYQLWNNELAPLANGLAKATESFRGWVDRIQKGSLACTAGAAKYPGLGMVHVRSMDWPLACGRHTLLLRHVNPPAGNFFSVGWPGYSGVLSGCKPGKYSATLNQAFVLRKPTLQWPPSHLLRSVFEECASYRRALEMLEATPVCVPSFILLAGTSRAAVIEMTPEGNVVHPMRKGRPIAIGNDYLSQEWREQLADRGGEDFDYLVGKTDSIAVDEPGVEMDDRRRTLLRRLKTMKPKDLKHAARMLQAFPIEHEESMQQMVFAHGWKGMRIIGREDDEPVSVYEVDHRPKPRAAS